MQAFLEALERLPVVEALKASFAAYPLLNAFHILAIGALVTSVLMLDIRVLGGFSAQPAHAFSTLMRRVAFAAFGAAALSGALLFAVQASTYAQNPAFLLKMGLIALAGLNFLVLARGGAGGAARVAAGVSLVLWPAILVAGRFVGFL